MSRYSLGGDDKGRDDGRPIVDCVPPDFENAVRAQHLSSLPVFVAGGALVLSTFVMVVGRVWPLPLLGWLLTPFVVVGCLVWARVLFLRASTNPLFDQVAARRLLVLLQAMTFVAFVASIPHVWRIGQEVALWLQ